MHSFYSPIFVGLTEKAFHVLSRAWSGIQPSVLFDFALCCLTPGF